MATSSKRALASVSVDVGTAFADKVTLLLERMEEEEEEEEEEDEEEDEEAAVGMAAEMGVSSGAAILLSAWNGYPK